MTKKELLDEIKSLIADAERYRFMKSCSRVISPNIDGKHSWTCNITGFGVLGPNLDEAIDNAIKANHG